MKNNEDFEFLKYNIKSWSVCNIEWDDFKISLSRDYSYEFQGGGRIHPLDENKMIYISKAGLTFNLPTKCRKALLSVLEAIENGESFTLPGIKNNEVYRKFKNKFSFFRRRTT